MALGREFAALPLSIHGRRVGEDYEFILADSLISFTISSLYEYRGDVKAEVRVRHDSSSFESIDLLRDRTTITGSTGKGRLASELVKNPQLREIDLPWREVIEVVCNAAIDTFRSGEPFLTLAKLQLPENPGFLVDKLLPRHQPTVLYGDGESCKSITALYLSIAIGSGTSLPNMKVTGKAGAVLYLDWETTWENQLNRLAKMCKGLGIKRPAKLRYRRMSRPLRDDTRAVKEEVDRLGVVFVVCDSLAMACGGDPREPQAAIGFFNALRSLGSVTALVIHHITWAEAEKKGIPRLYGTIYIRNQVRSAWAIQRAGEASRPYADVALWHDKANDSVHFHPMGLHYDFSPERIEIQQLDIQTVPDFAVQAPLPGRIRLELRPGEPMDAYELAKELGAKPDSVKKALKRMPDIIPFKKGGGKGKRTRYVLKAEGVEQQEIPF